MNGYGFANFANGDTYEGYLLDGNMEGFGLLYTAAERKYTLGFYKNNAATQVVESYTDKNIGDFMFSKRLLQ